jgi:hypothetical protein
MEETPEVDARGDVAGVQIEGVVVGGTCLERRAVLELDRQVAPLLGAETRQLGALRRRDCPDSGCQRLSPSQATTRSPSA